MKGQLNIDMFASLRRGPLDGGNPLYGVEEKRSSLWAQLNACDEKLLYTPLRRKLDMNAQTKSA